MLKILIDNNIRRLAVYVSRSKKEKVIKWGDILQVVPLAAVKGKPSRTDAEKVERLALAAIASEAKCGSIRFCTSKALWWEWIEGARGLQGTDGDLFGGIEIAEVPSAVEMSFFRPTVLTGNPLRGAAKEEESRRRRDERSENVNAFNDFLNQLDSSLVSQVFSSINHLPATTRESLLGIDRYQEVCASVHRNHWRDAFHLWTAERNELDIFLTADRRFINAIGHTKGLDFPVEPLLPSTLAERLNLKLPRRLPYLEGKTYGATDTYY